MEVQLWSNWKGLGEGKEKAEYILFENNLYFQYMKNRKKFLNMLGAKGEGK